MNEYIVLTLIFLGVGVIFIALSIPLILRRVPPNLFYGVRTTKTLSDENVWYEANHHFGKDFFGVGIFVFIAAIVAGMLGARVSIDLLAAALVSLLIVSIGIAVVRCLWKCRNLARN